MVVTLAGVLYCISVEIILRFFIEVTDMWSSTWGSVVIYPLCEALPEGAYHIQSGVVNRGLKCIFFQCLHSNVILKLILGPKITC
jgi:hypothetical protein